MRVKGSNFPWPPYPNWTATGVNRLADYDFGIKFIARVPDRE